MRFGSSSSSSTTLWALATCLSTLCAPVFGKSGPVNVAYVEVNTDSILNVGKYKLSDNSNAFDIGVIFAANINNDNGTAVLYNNAQVTSVLNNAASQIKPLQNQGIKVLLSILGNHQGLGFANFQSQDAASAFAQQVTNTVNQYGLDGVDLDDEYADYGTNNTPQPNSASIGYLLTALRQQMPNKLITFYYIGPSASSLADDPASIGSKLNYSWNPYYGTYSAPTVPGLGKSSLAPAAVEFGSTSNATAASYATMTVQQGYGVYLTYALTSGDYSSYISGITQALYGLSTTYTG